MLWKIGTCPLSQMEVYATSVYCVNIWKFVICRRDGLYLEANYAHFKWDSYHTGVSHFHEDDNVKKFYQEYMARFVGKNWLREGF